MNKETFESNMELLKTEWQAVCNEDNGHWESERCDSYEDAYNKSEEHLGDYPMHDVEIVKITYNKAKVQP